MSPPPRVNPTGYEWLERFLQEQAKITANCLFVAFSIGQTGAAMALAKTDEERERVQAMIEALESDRRDLKAAGAALDRVLRDMIANARRNAP